MKGELVSRQYLKTKQMVALAVIWIQDGIARLHRMDDLEALRSAQERISENPENRCRVHAEKQVAKEANSV